MVTRGADSAAPSCGAHSLLVSYCVCMYVCVYGCVYGAASAAHSYYVYPLLLHVCVYAVCICSFFVCLQVMYACMCIYACMLPIARVRLCVDVNVYMHAR